eukprot:2173695-Pyramimonas_sp.AAC.1
MSWEPCIEGACGESPPPPSFRIRPCGQMFGQSLGTLLDHAFPQPLSLRGARGGRKRRMRRGRIKEEEED